MFKMSISWLNLKVLLFSLSIYRISVISYNYLRIPSLSCRPLDLIHSSHYSRSIYVEKYYLINHLLLHCKLNDNSETFQGNNNLVPNSKLFTNSSSIINRNININSNLMREKNWSKSHKNSITGVHSKINASTLSNTNTISSSSSFETIRKLQTRQSDKSRLAHISTPKPPHKISWEYQNLPSQPANRYRIMAYDHLATTSLNGIEVSPYFRFKKGKKYLSKWWRSAKKWDLLSGSLKDLDERITLEHAMKTSLHANTTIGFNASELEYGDMNAAVSTDIEGIDNTIRRDIYSAATDFTASVNDSNRLDFPVMSDLSNIGDTVTVTDTYSSRNSDSKRLLVDRKEAYIENISFDELLNDDETSVDELSRDRDRDVNRDDDSDFDDNANNLRINGELGNTDTDVDIPISDDLDSNLSDELNASSYNDTDTDTDRFADNMMPTPFNELYKLAECYYARVIVVSDVHGCIDELCDLLRKVSYRPGDLVLLLGDLVAKGPSSGDVIRLAMDIGALCIRGNHEQEVIRQVR